jgi:hypothetical protein
MDRDIPIPQEVLDAEAPCDCGYPMSAHQRPDWFCFDWRKKHDELAELVACFFAIQDAMIWGRPIYGNASIRLMERNRLSKALRNAVEEK